MNTTLTEIKKIYGHLHYDEKIEIGVIKINHTYLTNNYGRLMDFSINPETKLISAIKGDCYSPSVISFNEKIIIVEE